MPDGCKQFLKKFFLKIEENSTAEILEHAEAKAVIANGVVEDVAENVAEDVGVVEDVAENVAEDVADGVPVEPPKKELRRLPCKTTSTT